MRCEKCKLPLVPGFPYCPHCHHKNATVSLYAVIARMRADAKLAKQERKDKTNV